MKKIVKKASNLPVVPAERQPAQLELFRLVSTESYINAFDFYEAIPRHMVAR